MQPISTRFKLALLIFITILPTILLVSFNIIQQYRSAQANSIAKLQQITDTFSAEQSQTVEGARQLLISLSSTPSIKNMDVTSCNNFLTELINNYQRYANFGVADQDGNLVCSAVLSTEPINFKNRLFFQKTLAEQRFVVGEYQLGQITKKPVLNFGYPIRDNNDQIIGVVFSSLDLSWVNDFITNSNPSEGLIFLLLDQNGTILARNPDPDNSIGKPFPDFGQIEEQLRSETITKDLLGVDGVRRFYVFKKLTGVEVIPANVVIGLPHDLVYQQARNSLITSIVILILTSLLVVGISWYIGNLLLIKKFDALEELDRQKTEFVSTASHQLRTPLSGMKMLIELLLGTEVGILNKKQRQIAKGIEDSNHRIISLVNALLDVSKIELGKLQLHPKSLPLWTILEKALNDLKIKAKSKKIKFNSKFDDSINVFADPKLLTQAFLNILDNAIKYSPEKSIVSVIVSRHSNMAMVRIADKGYGISASEKDLIFQKFHRGQNLAVQDIEGNGLGLYISKNIIEQTGGTITFTSQRNKGTAFIIQIPLFES